MKFPVSLFSGFQTRSGNSDYIGGPMGSEGVDCKLFFLRTSNFFRVSASLLLSEIKIIVRPPSIITGYLSLMDPEFNFERGTLAW